MFRNSLKYIVSALILAVLAGLIFVLSGKDKADYREKTCAKVQVEFASQGDLKFVTAGDVQQYITKDYGGCSGKRLEEIDLARIEEILDGKSSIMKSEAYITPDCVLHVLIYQREPVVRLITPAGGWYSDSKGFLFPVQKNYTSRVPIVDGNIPVKLSQGFRGFASTAKEKQWVTGILDLVNFMEDNRKWHDFIVQIHVNDNGELVIVPRKGKEKFVLGRPEAFGKKFAKIENYYKYIVPEKGEGAYSSVNVSFDGQIVCR